MDDLFENIIAEYENLVNNINKIKELCENNPNKIKIERNNNSVDVKNENEDVNDLCHIITVTGEWIAWSAQLTDKILIIPEQLINILSYITDTENIEDLLQMGIDKIIKIANDEFEKILNDPKYAKKIKILIKKIIRLIKLTILKVKEILLIGQLFVYKNLKKALENLANGKFNLQFNLIYPLAIDKLQILSNTLSTGLEIISNIISSLGVAMLSLSGGSMSFFMTPKTIINGLIQCNMKPIEPNNDLGGSVIMESINNVINEAINKIKDLNTVKKITYITSQISLYEALGEIPESKNLNLSSLNYNDIVNTVMNLLSTLAISEPLPEYEKLKITNIRYLLWLNTVFVPAMKTCFGIPGMP